MRSLRLLRHLFAIQLNQLASEAGVSGREIRRVERAEVVPATATLVALDRALLKLVFQRLAGTDRADAQSASMIGNNNTCPACTRERLARSQP
jgi:predicted transcriptional regulator